MDDVRLAVCHPDGAVRAGVAVRLRGATVEYCNDLLLGPPRGCNAILLAGPVSPAEVERILSAGVHVVLIADRCRPGDGIEGLYAAARTFSVQFAAVNPDRYLPSRQLIKKQLAGPLGEPGLIRLHRWEPPSTDRAGGPAALPDPLLRDIDLALWLAGRRPNRVYAVEQKAAGAPGRFVQVHLGFAGGGMALLDYSSRLPPGDGYQSLSVIAARGAAYADDHQNAQLLYRGGNAQAVRTDEHAGQFAAIAQEFVDALRAGQNLAAGVGEWRDVFAVADAVRELLASGQAVEVEAPT